jgi:hypothetical protein
MCRSSIRFGVRVIESRDEEGGRKEEKEVFISAFLCLLI